MTAASRPPRLTKAEQAELKWLDRVIAQLKQRRTKVKQKAHARTDHWRRIAA